MGHEIKGGKKKHSQKKWKNTHRIIHSDAASMNSFLFDDTHEHDSSLLGVEVWD